MYCSGFIRVTTLLASLVLLAGCYADNEIRIDSVEVESASAPFVSNNSLSLPFHTTVGRQQDQTLWLRFPTSALSDLEKPSLLISRAGSNFQVYLDNNWIFGRSFDERPMAHTWNIPYLVPINASALQQAKYVRIRLFAFAGDHLLLERIAIGEYDKLNTIYKRYKFLQTDLTAAVTAGTGFLGTISLILWIASGRATRYVIPIGASITLILANLNYFVVDHYMPHYWWQAITHTSLDWFGVFVILWILDTKGLPFRHVKTLLMWGVFTSVVNILLPGNWSVPFVEWLHFVTIAMVIAALVVPPNPKTAVRTEVVVSAVNASIGCVLCLFDLLIQFRIINGEGLPRFVPILFFAMFLANNIVLLLRFSITFKDAKRSSEELAQLVSEKEIEIDQQYQKLRKMELSQARMEERSEIMREVHDSMGGHLMSAMTVASKEGKTSTTANEEISAALQSALLEMRLLLNNSPVDMVDVGNVLGSLRARIEPLLSRAGIELIWKIDPLGDLPHLTAKNRMHLIRIIQECITNVLKHANATIVTIRSRSVKDGYQISVHDNGGGFDHTGNGNGKINMTYRADQIGGSFRLERKNSETVATLMLPNSTPSD